jgi:slime mold repeat-containing protein
VEVCLVVVCDCIPCSHTQVTYSDPNCDDGNDCTADSCTPTGCVHTPLTCTAPPDLTAWLPLDQDMSNHAYPPVIFKVAPQPVQYNSPTLLPGVGLQCNTSGYLGIDLPSTFHTQSWTVAAMVTLASPPPYADDYGIVAAWDSGNYAFDVGVSRSGQFFFEIQRSDSVIFQQWVLESAKIGKEYSVIASWDTTDGHMRMWINGILEIDYQVSGGAAATLFVRAALVFVSAESTHHAATAQAMKSM